MCGLIAEPDRLEGAASAKRRERLEELITWHGRVARDLRERAGVVIAYRDVEARKRAEAAAVAERARETARQALARAATAADECEVRAWEQAARFAVMNGMTWRADAQVCRRRQEDAERRLDEVAEAIQENAGAFRAAVAALPRLGASQQQRATQVAFRLGSPVLDAGPPSAEGEAVVQPLPGETPQAALARLAGLDEVAVEAELAELRLPQPGADGRGARAAGARHTARPPPRRSVGAAGDLPFRLRCRGRDCRDQATCSPSTFSPAPCGTRPTAWRMSTSR